MMRSFSVDDNNDLTLGNDGNISFATGVHAVLNVCRHVAQAIRAEMIFAQNSGLPDFQVVWNGAPKLAVWEVAFRSRILKVPSVISIQSLEIKQDGETMKYTAEIETSYGTGTIND